MSEIYQERLAANMPVYMDKSAKRLSLREALDKVLKKQEPQASEKLAELGAIALEEDMDWWLKRLLEERGLDG
ncbi:hypothetical protein HY379_01810 [Candidatus Saccharibacteria bacterium]|nr:hypothetical protein [Candidatus Saccharibacteria bacterium]